MKYNILLTGATGFLGSNLRDHLVNKNIPHIAISRSGNKVKGILDLNLHDSSEVQRFFSKNKFTTVLHVAGFVNLSRDYATTLKCIEDNIIATINLLEACKNNNKIRFIFASTEEIYGSNTLPYTEIQNPAPPSPYSISKLTAENYISYYSEIYNINSIILRLGTMYGPYMKKDRLIYQIINNAINNQPIMLNSGKKERDYMFVEDAVDAFLLASKKSISGKSITINIGFNKSIKLQDLVKKILAILKSSSHVRYNVLPERNNENKKWIMDTSRAKELLDWYPKTTIEEGLKKTIEHYKLLTHS